MSRLSCASGCGTFLMDDELEGRLRANGNEFYCPQGHVQYFKVGPDPRDRKIGELNRFIDTQRRRNEQLNADIRMLREVMFGSTALYPCGECGKQHRYDSPIGAFHLKRALKMVTLKRKEVHEDVAR